MREGSFKGLGTVQALQDKAQATFNDFNNTLYRTDRVYQPGYAVYVALALQSENGYLLFTLHH